jgi:hypothetical protein
MTGSASVRALERIKSGTRSKYSGEMLTAPFAFNHKATFAKEGKSVYFNKGIVVILPKPFFKLSQRQSAALGQKFMDYLAMLLKG